MHNPSVDTSGFVGYLGKFRHANKQYHADHGADHSSSHGSANRPLSSSQAPRRHNAKASQFQLSQAEITENSTRQMLSANDSPVQSTKAKVVYKKARRNRLKDCFN